MTIRELIAQGVRKARTADWEVNEYLELPQPDPDGSVSESVRLVCGDDGHYFPMNYFSGDVYIPYNEIPISIYSDSIITFDQARNYILKFHPKYAGMTLDQVAKYNDGLRYLDYIVGQSWLHQDTRDHIKVYLANNGIKRDLKRLIDG